MKGVHMLFKGNGTEQNPYEVRAGKSVRSGLFAVCAIVIAEKEVIACHYRVNIKNGSMLFLVRINTEGPVQQIPKLVNVALHESFTFLVHETVVTATRVT